MLKSKYIYINDKSEFKAINRALKVCDTIGTCKNIQTNFDHLKRIKILLKAKLGHVGRGGKINRSDRVR